MTYADGELSFLKASEAVRRRPALYIGDLSQPAAINTLLVETLCISLDAASAGEATEINITLAPNGSASVSDNGPGLPMEFLENEDKTVFDDLFENLYACRRRKQHADQADLCSAGIVCTNALSEWLTVINTHDGESWFQRYSRGEKDGPLAKVMNADKGWRIHFLPDSDIFGDAKLDPEFFMQWFRSLEIELPPDVTVRLNVMATNTTHVLTPLAPGE